jgi:hypothetical protein
VEALTYERPLGLVFRKAVLWHDGQQHIFQNLKETAEAESMLWDFRCATQNGTSLRATIDGRGQNVLHLPYTKTDCSGAFEVANNSLASASLLLEGVAKPAEMLETKCGAVLEVVG